MTPPTVSQFKTQFARDFAYGTTSDKVKDEDITSAILMADGFINELVFETEAFYQRCYNLVAAHFLVTSLKASSQGISATYDFVTSSKGVGSVSQSFAIPQEFLNNPIYNMLSKTPYGAMYLSIIIPKTYGGVTAVSGGSLA